MLRPSAGSRMTCPVVFAAIILLTMSARALCQETSAIEGIVKDEQGAVVPGVTVTARNQETGVARVTVSDVGGHYRVAALRPSKYSLKVELPGFRTEEAEITLTVGFELRQDFVLRVESVQESLTVTAVSSLVDTTKSEVSGVVTQQQIATLPIDTRQILTLSLLMPGTGTDAIRPYYSSVSIGAGGASFYSTQYLVDGAINRNVEQGEPKQDFPQDAVREFKLDTLGFKAENGLATGGLVSIVTKSGTNEFSGNAFEYFRDKALNAQGVFETVKPAYQRNQFGGSFGGPIIKDKVHFFASEETTRINQFFTVNTGLPADYASVEGTFGNSSHKNLYFGRVDDQLNKNQALFIRYALEQEVATCFTCGGTHAANSGYDQGIPRNSWEVGHTWILSDRLLNDFRFYDGIQIFEGYPAGTPAFDQPGVYTAARLAALQRVYVFPSMTYGPSYSEIEPERRYEFRDDFSVNSDWHGSHVVKFGSDYSRILLTDDQAGNLGGTYTFSSDQYFNPNDPTSIASLKNANLFAQQLNPVTTSATTSQFALYIQDDWKLTDRATLNLGLRYDRQFGSFNEFLNPSSFSRPIPFIDPQSRGDKDNFGPRVGFVYDVTGHGRGVLRAAYGIYYDSIRTLPNFSELRNLTALTVNIRNPTYPDPFGGQSPTQFISAAPPNISILSNDFANPESQQFNVGFTRQLVENLAVSVDAVYAHTTGDREVTDVNFNPITGLKIDPTWARINETTSTSNGKYRALYVQLDKRFSHRFLSHVSYTLAKTDDNLVSHVTDQTNPGSDFGPSNADRRHSLVASGAFLLPEDITLGAVWTYRSSLPFSAMTGVVNADGFQQYVPGTSRNQGNRGLDWSLVNAYRATAGLPPVSESAISNSRFNSVDVRGTKQFALKGRQKFEVIAQAFNVFNTTNLIAPFQGVGYVQNVRSASFARILTANHGRQAELAVRFIF